MSELAMFLFEGGLGVALFVLWVFAIFDVVATDSSLCRNLPKMYWLMLVIFLPEVGSVAWLLLGRPEKTRFVPGSTTYRPSGPRGPEDLPGFSDRMKQLGSPPPYPKAESATPSAEQLRAWEQDLRRREEQMKEQEGKKPPAGEPQ